MALGDQLKSLAMYYPQWPAGWHRGKYDLTVERIQRRFTQLDGKIESITAGRTMPDLDRVLLGSGKHFDLSILFIDICGFSSWPSSNIEEQSRVLAVLNIFMTEMLAIVRDYKGTFEKNTGDGIMSYFGAEIQGETIAARVAPAVFAAGIMNYVNDALLSPMLQARGYWPVKFRTAIDHGKVTIARVGIKGDENSFVAVGSSANLACKLMKHVPDGGICIGNEAYKNLPPNWASLCTRIDADTGFYYVSSGEPYPAWKLNYSASEPYV